MAIYQITIPDSVVWHKETRVNPPFQKIKTKLSIYTLYLDLVYGDAGDNDDARLRWIPTIYDDIVDAEIATSFNDDTSWEEDDLETAKAEILAEALNQLRARLVDDFDAVEISSDDIGSLVLEN